MRLPTCQLCDLSIYSCSPGKFKTICGLFDSDLIEVGNKMFPVSFQLRVIRQNELPESWVRRMMYEDRDDCGNATYVEYLCHVHKEVRALLK